eukprot:CAMPEP_0172164120 /NCGR_PEP_ID=MMETSP1050-20130122/7666_1 /TAXON_ID=233186 /ORGANISM="Cryptomonas curvata, Strain CCAP979/52" /LENGTH=189 /DNA_ID=CAMNT_0012834417 /DNA_START=1 /DNA_END=567 /DNA_ORIENTATION=-
MESISLSATTSYPESFSGTRNTNLGETQGPASRTPSNSGLAPRNTGLGEFQGPSSRTPSNSGLLPVNTGSGNGHKSAPHQDSARTAASNPRRGSTGPDLASRAHGGESAEDNTAQYMVSNPGVQPDLMFGGRTLRRIFEDKSEYRKGFEYLHDMHPQSHVQTSTWAPGAGTRETIFHKGFFRRAVTGQD